ncbi:MAG: DUF481 domain-containing protein [Bacteroidetes bacterium]|nr:DUF481 domain-containing protein [Bacteroidota bacterium]
MNKLMRIIGLAFVCLSQSFLSFSQILNIDKTDTDAYVHKAAWNGSISAGMEIDKQKTTLFDASNFLDGSLQKFHEFYVLSAANRFTYNGPNDFLNAGYIHLRWRHNYKNKWHPESYLQYQWDDGRGILHRYLLGENMRYNLWRSHKWELSVATGLMYEDEIWNYTAVDSSKIPLNHPNVHSSHIKSNNYIKWDTKLSANSNLAFTVYYQALFNHFGRPRIATNLDFNVAVSKHFLFALKFNSLYDDAPVVPIFKFYYNFSYNVVYKF